MSNPFVGEIRMFGFNFAPRGWSFCNGAVLSIAQNTALFSLLGTTYGGNGQSTFALPDLRSRLAINQGQGPGLADYVIGQQAGTENVTLTNNTMPTHQHDLTETNAKIEIGARTEAPTSSNPNGGFLGGANIYVTGQTAPNGGLKGSTVAFASGAKTNPVGGSLPFSILQPYLTVNFCIALVGIFPSRN